MEGAEDCERCNLPRWLAEIAYDQDLHVHHLNYACLSKETFHDVEILCRRCHEIETFGRSDLKAPKKSVCESCKQSHYNPRSSICVTCDEVFNAPWLWFASDTSFECDVEQAVENLLALMKKRLN
jgi:hypothetical protein